MDGVNSSIWLGNKQYRNFHISPALRTPLPFIVAAGFPLLHQSYRLSQ
jgi:hypothetical protein